MIRKTFPPISQNMSYQEWDNIIGSRNSKREKIERRMKIISQLDNEHEVRQSLEETFVELTFTKVNHCYYWEGIKVPISVSGLVSNHAYPFEKEKWLPRCAKKEGVTEQELEQRWENKKVDACKLGSDTHNFLEHFTGIGKPKNEVEEAGLKFFKELDGGRYKLIKRELMVFSKRYSFAGTLDLPLWDSWNKTIVIGDYKTNADLFKTYGMLKPPFDYLENHPYNKYQLQLSYYQLALEEWGYKVSDRILIYLKRDGSYEAMHLYDFTAYLREFLN